MASKYRLFDRSRLRIQALGERASDLHLSHWLALDEIAEPYAHPDLAEVARRLAGARAKGAARILMMGAHVLRAGVNRQIIDLLERGYIDHIALNGAGVIHDYELARIGATTESVARYIRTGEFGLWRETGELNDWVSEAAAEGLGLGENAGRRIEESDYAHRDLSVLAAAWRCSVPATAHVGIGYDILHEHPNCDGAAYGAASYRDFLIFARTIERLEGGVLLSFGSAIMAPEVYLKALAMARNVAHQEGRAIRDFATAVFDLVRMRGDPHRELPKSDFGYYFRPHKTLLVRTVADGGASFYFCGDHRATLPALRRVILGKRMTTAEVLAGFGKLSALVVGDICLDRWCTYDPGAGEPSRETGIPRIGVVRTEISPGAGGTVANNLAALGAGSVAVLGAIGEDGFGVELERALGERGISSELCVRSADLQTFTYTKVINGGTGIEDQPRLDFINTTPLAAEVERRILDHLQMSVERFDVILIADQAETSQGGVVTPAVRELLAELAPVYPDRIFFADSRARIHLFRNVIVKPNRQEAESACGELSGRVDLGGLRRHTQAPLMFVTGGGDGVWVVDEAGETFVPARRVEHPVDICGAGDSFSAGASLALRVTGSAVEAARFGNLVAAVTIMKKGTGTASPEEVLAAYGRETHAGD